MSKRQWSFGPRIMGLLFALVILTAGLHAQSPEGLVLFVLDDELGNRFEITMYEGAEEDRALLVRYSHGDHVILEQPLHGNLNGAGRIIDPFRLRWSTEEERNDRGAAPLMMIREKVLFFKTGGAGVKSEYTSDGDPPIADNTGNGVPPTGPPPSQGGG